MIHRYLVVAVALALAAPSSVPAQSVKAGIRAWQQADYAKAVDIWRPLAEKGDADAAFNLGQAYRLGRGVETNIAAASTWYERAAAKGHLDAQTTLGLLLFQNGDQAGGLGWLKKAADKGEPRALLVYGTALVNGDGIKRDLVLGYALVSRAAAHGLAPAKETLAQLDQLLSAEARKKGVAIAMAKAKSIPAPSSASVRQPPAPKPIEMATAKAVEVPADGASSQKPSNARDVCGEAADVDLAGRNLVRRCRHAVVARAAAQPQAAAAPATGAWRIQLGAFSKRSSAEAMYQRVSGNAALARRQPFYIAVGAITRLQVGPFESKAAAESACTAVGTACFPVPGK